MPEKIQLVVGLGNPGPEYQYTRHNAGAWFVQMLAQHYNVNFKQQAPLKAHIADIRTASGERCRLAKPTTFMNHSGEAVQALARFYKLAPAAILIAHDELDFPCGTARLKQDGGHGGHNGLRSLLQHLTATDFLRLRIGIGHPGRKELVHNYVLSRPSAAEFTAIMDSVQPVIAVLPDLLNGHVQTAIKALHSEGEKNGV